MAGESRGESTLSLFTMTKFAVVLETDKPLPIFRTLRNIRSGRGLSVGLNDRKQNQQRDDSKNSFHGASPSGILTGRRSTDELVHKPLPYGPPAKKPIH